MGRYWRLRPLSQYAREVHVRRPSPALWTELRATARTYVRLMERLAKPSSSQYHCNHRFSKGAATHIDHNSCHALSQASTS